MKKLDEFKIKVTPEQSKIVQETLFKEGYKWNHHETNVSYSGIPYLFINRDMSLAKTENLMWFSKHTHPEITFEDFHKMFIYDNPNVSMEDCIDKKDVSPYFKSIEDMKEALEFNDYICKSDGYLSKKYYIPFGINYNGVNCTEIDCSECPFAKLNKNLLKEMLPLLKEEGQINQTINGKKEGYWEEYWNNGKLKSKGNYKNGNRDGYWEWYYRDGKLASKGNYKDGLEDGYWESYYSNGNMESKRNYKNGLEDGYWEFYHDNMKLCSKGNYKDGEREGLWEWYYRDGNYKNSIDYGIKKDKEIIEYKLKEKENMKNELKTPWCVRNDGSQLFIDTVIKYLNNYNNKKMAFAGGISWINHYYGIMHDNTPNNSYDIDNFGNDVTVYNLNEFIRLTTNEKEMSSNSKLIIGYKLKEDYEQYAEAAQQIMHTEFSPDSYNVSVKRCIEALQESGVLTLWFEPIYKEKETITITIGDLKGTIDIKNKCYITEWGNVTLEELENAITYLQNPPKLAGYALTIHIKNNHTPINKIYIQDTIKIGFGCKPLSIENLIYLRDTLLKYINQ